MTLRSRSLAALVSVFLFCVVLVGEAAAQTSVWIQITVPSVYVRKTPAWSGERVASLFENQTVQVTGKNDDGAWLRIRIAGAGEDAWVHKSVGRIIGSLSSVSVVPAGSGAPAASSSTTTATSTASTQTTQSTQSSAGTVSSLRLTISADSTFARSGPGFSNSRVASLFKGETYFANGRSADSAWLRIAVPGAGNLWISRWVADLNSNPDRLPVVSSDAGTTTTQAQTASAPTATPVTRVVTAPALSTSAGGFELGGQAQGFGNEAVSAMQRAGMTWVKRQVRWAPQDVSSSHVGLINEAHARGFKVLLSITGSSLDDATAANFPTFAQFAAELAAAGADGIEVWNEQNIIRGDGQSIILPATFANLMAHAYPAIKAANPGTLVISGAPAPTGFFGGCSTAGCDDNHFIAGFAAAGGLAYTDCLGIHYNEGIVSPTQSSGDPRGNPNHYTRYYQTMVNTYYSLAGGQRPLCFTELGYLSGEEWGYIPQAYLWRPPYNLTLAEQAQYLAEAASLSRSQGRVRLLIVFNVDITVFGDDPQAGYAMIRPGGGCPACDTLGAVMGAG